MVQRICLPNITDQESKSLKVRSLTTKFALLDIKSKHNAMQINVWRIYGCLSCKILPLQVF